MGYWQFMIKRIVVNHQLAIQILKSHKSKICQWHSPKALETGCFHSKCKKPSAIFSTAVSVELRGLKSYPCSTAIFGLRYGAWFDSYLSPWDPLMSAHVYMSSKNPICLLNLPNFIPSPITPAVFDTPCFFLWLTYQSLCNLCIEKSTKTSKSMVTVY